MLIQLLLGIGFIGLSLVFAFGLPLIQEYFSKDVAFSDALDDCESLLVDEAHHNIR